MLLTKDYPPQGEDDLHLQLQRKLQHQSGGGDQAVDDCLEVYGANLQRPGSLHHIGYEGGGG